LPIICLILFALDTHYALFCIDTSFVFMIVWPFIAMFFFINLICYLFHVIHAYCLQSIYQCRRFIR
jgi:hypothetical protein